MLLKDYYPDFIVNSKIFSSQLDADQVEHNKIYAAISEIIDQLYVETATWGLDSWEKFLEIDISQKPYEYRRAVILSKIRSCGTSTKQAIKDMSLAFQNGEVDVIENSADYSFKIKFTGVRGVPPNLQDFLDAIEEIKPAHLGFTYEFTYNPWLVFNGKLWGEYSSKTFEQLSELAII